MPPQGRRPPASGVDGAPTFSGRNHLWIPSLGINRSIAWFPCSRAREPDNYVYRWGCAGSNNVYLLGHAWGVFKPLHDAYASGRLKVGMKAMYADANGRVARLRGALVEGRAADHERELGVGVAGRRRR